ncbi:2-hydroxy-3-oxopropionate reductase [Abditibacterium utsteinense]|uniref:2-hydroxy-3-oxopropionate reductase n=1 Tax=Abditibacterium utsteinense TaxID=1960156 RepID=A0A2S8SQ13_9BACT|nr:NAD(P)-dependent oxidoreductase [Abditibacterium utsteinense]PQV62874.1 2-hydroxy-3-oxopropionate reductase [Abditibacterium utsteinense]
MKIAVLGLGIIGSVWAQNLAADDHEMRAWNRTPQADFPGFVPDIPAAVEDADFVFIVVADPAAVEAVLEVALPLLKSGQTVVQSSTISPHWTLEFARKVEETGAAFLEAPFTGSKPAAIARETVFYLGGDAELIEKARPILDSLSKKILHIGPLGSASALKLAMNLNIAGVAQTLTESLNFARKCGLSDDMFFEALSANVSKSGIVDLKEPKLRAADYAPQFSLKHLEKDLRLALETAQENGIELPQTASLRELYLQGLKKGWGDEDFIGLERLLHKK